MGEGMISCSYNYSNFDDEPVVTTDKTAVSPGDNALLPSFGARRLEEKESELISFYEELASQDMGDFRRRCIESDGRCVMSSEPEIDNAAVDCGTSRGGKVAGKGRVRDKKRTGALPMQEPFKQEGGVALWVKWRGKWRACIQCYPNDFSTATARAMPTYSKKTYVVVFFPNSRTYSWVDLEYACHITETPEPLAFGTHQSGRDAVENLDLPKHHMLRVLAANMLDISDRLPVKAVVESAQTVDAWKDFANEAVEAKEYSDISKMLVKLFGMVQESCYSDSWIQESFDRWKTDCEVADSAQAVENLNKELVNAILWEDISALWDAPEQSAVGAEWKDWKRAVIENRSVYPSISLTPDKSLFLDSENLKRRRMVEADVDLAIKRSKLEVRRRYPTQLVPAANKDENPQAEVSALVEVSGFSGDNQQEDRAGPFRSPPVFSTPASQPRILDEDNLSGRSSSLVQQNSLTVSKRLASNYQLCAAYMEAKRRQCTRFPSSGSLYCCKHMSLATGNGIEGVKKLELTPQKPASAPLKSSTTIFPKLPGDRICEGMTKYGRRCTHRSKDNSLFCKKHSLADAPHLDPQTAAGMLERRETERVAFSTPQDTTKAEAQVEQEPGLAALEWTPTSTVEKPASADEKPASTDEKPASVIETSAIEKPTLTSEKPTLTSEKPTFTSEKPTIEKPTMTNENPTFPSENPTFPSENPTSTSEKPTSTSEKPTSANEKTKNYSWHARRIGRIIKSNANAATRIRCLGTCVTGDQCSHKSRPGSDYCEKHQPDNDGQEEPVLETKKQDEAQALLKAKTWLGRYMESAKLDGAGSSEAVDSSEKLLEWVLAEASKDMPAALNLVKLVNQRKEKLERFLKLQERAEASNVEKLVQEGSLDTDNKAMEHLSDDEHRQLDKIKCSICDDEFTEMVELGSHWKSSHPTEAHWFVKGYACRECKKEFTNKSSLERHFKSDHEAVTDFAALTVTVCINCDEQFSNFEVLWDHVVTGHPDHLSAMPTISLPVDDDDDDDDMEEDTKVAEDGLFGKFDVISLPSDATDVVDKKKLVDYPEDDGISSEEQSFEDMDVAEYLDPSRGIGESIPEENGGGGMKYTCKVCGKRFRALPDLGRHHQADHMSANVGTISKARTGGIVPGARRQRKRMRVSKQGMNSILRIKKALHSVQQQKNEKSESPRLPGPPGDEETLAAASAACCGERMYAILDAKYEQVHNELPASVLTLAAERNVEIKWTREGYVCSENCSKLFDRTQDMRLHTYRKGAVPLAARKNSVVVCEDISFGKEFTPVPCVEDEETEPCTCPQCREGKSYHVDSLKPWESFSYVTRRLLDPSLGVDTKDSQVGCSCGRGRCTAKSCDHVGMFDSDYAEACDIWGEEMMGRFPYDGEGRIILQEGYLVYECNTSCVCAAECPNRVLQKGVRVKLEVFKTRHKGWAVRAAQHIARGTFVCEYLGEVLNDQEANKRGERYDQVGCSYLYDIDAHLKKGGRSRRGQSRLPRLKPFVIDATKLGNVSRFINHSCSPNLVNYQVLVESMDYQLAHIGLYASRDISCGEELAYDYRYRLLPGRGCPCHCGSSGCRGRLY